MFRLLKRYQTPILVSTAVLLPLVVYRANARAPSEANLVDKIVYFATEPLKRMLGAATDLVSDAWSQYVDLAGARRENGELRRRLEQVESERDSLRTLSIENRHLLQLLEIADSSPSVELRVAPVIGAGTSPLSRTIEIGRGSLHGVRRGVGVLAGQGLVGFVQRVGWSSAEVVLIADERIPVRALVVRTGARAQVRGRGQDPGFSLELSEILRSEDVRPGDRIVTSGLGGVLPKGIPIGVVSEVGVDAEKHRRIGVVEPYADFARLEWVSVIIGGEKGAELVTPEPLLPDSLRSRPGSSELLPEDPEASSLGAGTATTAAGEGEP